MNASQQIHQLKEELNKYRLMFEHAPLGMFHLNHQGVVTDCNDQLGNIVGAPKEKVLGINALTLENSAYVSAVRQAMAGNMASFEGAYTSVAGGKSRFLRVLFAPTGEPQKGSWEVVAIVEDITEKQQAAQQLKASEERFQIALENSGDGVWDWDLKSDDTDVTDNWLERLGYQRHEIDLSLEGFLTYVHADDREKIVEQFQCFSTGKTPQFSVLFRMRCRDGTFRWFSSVGKPVEWSEKGEPMRAIGTHRDVTAQQEAIEALKVSERSKSVLLSNLPGMAYRCEYIQDTWQMTYISEGCFDLTGYPAHSLKGTNQSLKELILPRGIVLPEYREKLWDKWLQMMREQKAFRSEYPIITAEGETKWVWEQGRVILDDIGRVNALECFVTDITERREAEEKNRRLDKLKDEFLANTSHELRTPLNGIISIVESLLKGIGGSMTSDQRQNLLLVRLSARRLAALVNDILDFSRIRHHDLRLHLRPVDLHSSIRLVMDLFRHQAEHRGIQLVNQISPHSQMVLADENRLSQIFFNLIGNALRYTEKGSITVTGQQQDDMMKLTVADTGIGIPEERQDNLFEYYEQAGLSPEREYSGTGLGLPITRQLVELHGGTIQVCSVVGQGSAFTFTLPLARRQESQERLGHPVDYAAITEQENMTDFYVEPLTGSETAHIQQSEFTVLVVDDEPVNRQSLMNILALKKMSVVAAESGHRALELLKGPNRPDLCIIDIMMPRMNGYELCHKIRERFTSFELPVIFLTARYGETELNQGFKVGGNDFLHKPFEESELLARVETLLHLKKSVEKAMVAEIAFLQAQIKPHFLYNALNTIAAYCEVESEKAGRLILSLSTYLRGSLAFDNLQQTITLEQELQLTKAYAEIEQARFPQVAVTYQIEEAASLRLPPLVIQPLVENAIRHGICPRREGGEVSVKVMEQVSGYLVEVSDNGVGVDIRVLHQAMNQSLCGKSVGLCNIQTRLKRLYGQGLQASSHPEKGTCIRFLIPRQ
ncbi:ATP-binding protein [Anoxynatronum sibiricum]|uniref:Stage 0 sporulation protein A homolog n=1 Tax=Anoxynatronum sibiricum TaxID=210623 RepID=A0ABU9VRZ0_9CLOT